MRAIPYDERHLTALDLGTEERRGFDRFGTKMFDALKQCGGPAWSLVEDDGRIVGCFGMLAVAGNGVLWAVLSDQARANHYGLHRAAKRQLAQAQQLIPVRRIVAAVRREYEPGRRWVMRLGFTYDGEFAVAGEQYERYVK